MTPNQFTPEQLKQAEEEVAKELDLTPNQVKNCRIYFGGRASDAISLAVRLMAEKSALESRLREVEAGLTALREDIRNTILEDKRIFVRKIDRILFLAKQGKD